jgi:hypothetical protein
LQNVREKMNLSRYGVIIKKAQGQKEKKVGLKRGTADLSPSCVKKI